MIRAIAALLVYAVVLGAAQYLTSAPTEHVIAIGLAMLLADKLADRILS